MPGHFITKYGDRIDFIDGYFDLFPDLVAQYRDVIQIYDDFSAYLEQQGQSRGNTPPVQGAAYLARHARTANMIHMLERFDVSRQFRSVLDIGTGYGIMPRLMKAYGIAERAYGLDLTDRTHFVSSEQILAYERDLEATRRADALKARLNRHLPFRFEPTGWPRKASHPEFGFVMNDANFFPRVTNRNIDLDGLAISDVYQYQTKHDLITSFCSLCCFDSEKIIQKVSEILDDEGIFFVHVNLWWFPINSTTIVGNFPYSHCRLERDDWERYCKTFHPQHFASMSRLYDVLDSRHPTVSNYIETASRNGLTLLGYERCIHNQPHDPRSRLSPNYLETFFDGSYLGEVLSNIRRFRSDVSIEDLQTSHVFLVFQKRPHRSPLRIDAELIARSRGPLDAYGSYTTLRPPMANPLRTAPARARSLLRDGILAPIKAKVPPAAKARIKKLIGRG